MARCNVSDFTGAVEKLLDQYSQDLSSAVESGLDEAEKYLINQMIEASPKETGDYKSHWKAGTSGKGYRRVVNDKTVPWKGRQQSLAGILEYSTQHGKPHIEATRRKARPKILKILKDNITAGAEKP